MSAVEVPDVVETVEEYLDDLAATIRREYARIRESLTDAHDAYLTVGHSLLAARRALPSDKAFGAWKRAQGFEFTAQWARVLQQGAEHEPTLRPLLQSQLASSGRANFEKAVKQARAASLPVIVERRVEPEPEPEDLPELDDPPTEFSAIVIDPPWRYDNTITRGAAEDHYPTMGLEELAALTFPAAADSHLYLWVTNGFLREGFWLLEQWGFEYKACLTWCKPQIGMGNYFRNSTEHVYFAVRGKLPTNANNIATHFIADRTRHSAKPEAFYDIVERSSPGPYLEMFARRRRLGWQVWGNEA